VLLSEVVVVLGRVAATRSRSAKISALAELFTRLGPEEVEAAVAMVAGEPRQGKIGVGWAALMAVDVAPAELSTLTVGDLDAAITALSGLIGAGAGSAATRNAALADLLGRATAEEAELIRALLVGELRQGALQGVATDAVARAAGVGADSLRRAAMLAGDLGHVAVVAFRGGERALAAIGLEVLRPVLPMLASTAADAGAAVLALGLSSVEWKLDGARVGDEVRLFTRNLNDVTGRLPGVTAIVRSLPVDQVVLDGEVLGLGDDARPDRFAESMSRFGRHDGADRGLTVAFFDCMHLDGADLVDRPLVERLEALEGAVGRWRVRSVLTDDPARAIAFAEGAIAAGHEGVMVKAAGSRYEAGRRGQAWRKVKPVRTLDLVVVGAEWGHGRRRGWLSNLHLGARDVSSEDSGVGFVMVGKTFKGLTDELLVWQTARLTELAVSTTGHVVSVRPELVVEIALDGAQSSTRYAGGVALRFARVRRYRPDKVPADADTIDAVRALLG